MSALVDEERRTPERNGLMVGAEPELVIRYRDAISQASGFAVIDTLSMGVAFGGVRVSPTLNWTEIAPLARSASIRYQLARVSIGGARVGLAYDPQAPDLEEVLGRFLTSLRAMLESSLSIGPDLNVPIELLDRVTERYKLPWRMTAVQRNQGWPVERWDAYQHLLRQRHGGFTLRDVQVAHGVAQGVMAMGEFLFHRQQTVGVVGTGPFGLQIARQLLAAGASVVAVGGTNAGIYAAGGLRPEVLQSGANLQMSLDSSHLFITHEELFAMPLDVLVLAATSDMISIENVGKLRASLVVEAAARSVTQSAERVLFGRGTPILPSFAVTMGAVLVADAVLRNQVDDVPSALAHVAEQSCTTVRELARLSATLRIPLRDAGTRLAFHRWESLPPALLSAESPTLPAEEEPPEAL